MQYNDDDVCVLLVVMTSGLVLSFCTSFIHSFMGRHRSILVALRCTVQS